MTEPAPSEPADLVDVFYAPFVRPLGNLTILFAQAEAAWLVLVATLTGCTEKEAQRFLQKDAATAKQEIMPLAKTTAIESYELEELCKGIETFYGEHQAERDGHEQRDDREAADGLEWRAAPGGIAEMLVVNAHSVTTAENRDYQNQIGSAD